MGLERPRIRPEILGFEPYSPGLTIGEITRQYKLDRVVKMASNENPLGASPMAVEAIERHAGLSFRYPQAGNPVLTEALSSHLGVQQGCIVPGNGSDELIDLLVRVTARPGCDNIVVCDPSFSIYSMQAALCGVEVRRVPLGQGHSLPLAELLKAADQNTGLVFVTTPDNPSGVATPAVELEKMARDLPRDTLLVIDEAYVDFPRPRGRFHNLCW
ncbi:MAG: pyridoxal phosphate-dependent aminotransferase, partial [Desulfohalobiaceae bacterium]